MDKELLKRMRARHQKRLEKLRNMIESNEVEERDLDDFENEIDDLTEEIAGIDEELGEPEPTDEPDPTVDSEPASESNTDADPEPQGENRSGMISQQQRDGLLGKIGNGVKSRGKLKTKEIRNKFSQLVLGQLDMSEARSLGMVSGNGSILVPKELVPEVISYAQEINPLRTDGTMHRTKSQLGFPVLVKKAEAHGHKTERGVNNAIPDTVIEFDEIELDPTEFDALALITKKLAKRSDINVDDIVMEELGKAYAQKEGQYFFRGDEVGNENPGALAKKAVQFYATKDDGTGNQVAIDGKNGSEMHDTLVDMKNSVRATIRRKSKWYLNDAAIGIVEKMKDNEGRPLYKALDQLKEGIDGKLLGYPTTITEFADKAENDIETPVFYFGDPKSFHMQEVEGTLEVQKLVEKYADTNHIGIKIYNLIDGQLIYSPYEPTMYRMELGALPTSP